MAISIKLILQRTKPHVAFNFKLDKRKFWFLSRISDCCLIINNPICSFFSARIAYIFNIGNMRSRKEWDSSSDLGSGGAFLGDLGGEGDGGGFFSDLGSGSGGAGGVGGDGGDGGGGG